MQVANALNNSIRILFNPRVEAFKLFDFLMVKSDEERYLAQIIEIYDDKFDASQNVAKLKLFYKIAENNEVMPYDNFTPNKECEIIKIKQDEVEQFINNDKKTFIFGTNTKNSESLNIQYDFFNKNCVILADKIEHANMISLNLAKNLSKEHHTVIIDSTGILELEEAKTIKASKNFKMPLNYTTIDFVFQRLLSDASLEFQAIGCEILNEIKKFARKQENGFIPFNAFTRVLMEQYKVTPYKELRLLLARLKKCQMNEIFARSKKDVDSLFKIIKKNPITIIDLSGIDVSWQKAYLEYIVSDIEDKVYLITRVNEENCDVELINKVYNEKRNICFVPNASYTYKKLPTIAQYCKNYILMPSLCQRQDFLDANFALSNLISDGCIIFGEQTDNFIYLAKDYELETQEKRKNYRKIALTLIKEDEKEEAQAKEEIEETSSPSQEKAEKSHSERLMEELTNFEEERAQEKANENFEEQIDKEEGIEEEKEIDSEEEKPKELEETVDYFDNAKAEEVKEIEETEKEEEFDVLEDNKTISETQEETKDEDSFEEIEEEKIPSSDSFEEIEEEKEIEIEETKQVAEEKVEVNGKELITPKEKTFADIFSEDEEELEKKDEEINIEETEEVITQDETADEIPLIEEEKEDTVVEKEQPKESALSDEELDFFQIAQESSFEENSNNESIQVENKDKNEELDLSEVANNSIDNSFNEIINTKNEDGVPTLDVSEDIKINIDKQMPREEKEKLPIFKEELEESQHEYSVGEVVNHKKYGKGTITKIIPYEQRQLLQIEFEESGKKLLDPTVANLKTEQ